MSFNIKNAIKKMISNEHERTLFERVKRLFRFKKIAQKICSIFTWFGDYKVVRTDSILWLCNKKNFIDRRVGVFKGYEKDQINFLLSNMNGGCDCFIDAGANFGLYTMYVAHSGLAKKMFAFEPDHRNYAQLEANLYLNKYTSVVDVYKVGLSDSDGSIKFELSTEISTGQSKIVDSESEASDLVTIDITTLDKLFDFQGKKIFIKIDVEGHEERLLKGADDLLRNNKCFIQMEAWVENADHIKSKMSDLGYKCINRIAEDYYFTNF